MSTAALTRLQRQLADMAAVTEIECCAVPLRIEGVLWYDLRPMQDPARHCPDTLAIGAQHIEYALLRGLAITSATQPHLVRLAR